MKFTRQIINSRKIKKLEPIEILAEKIEDVILNNTPSFLHDRIKNRLDGITLDVKYDMTSSEYLDETDTVMININCINSFDVYLHEIMHAIGTQKTDSTLNIGLNKRSEYKISNDKALISNFGFAANEGLNQHYTESFLPQNISPSEVVSFYSFCANIMSSIENMVGVDICKNAHFSGKGLTLLIENMQNTFHLNNENKAVKLLLALDAYMTVAKTHMTFGVEHTPDTRNLLLECYKSLLSLAIRKAKYEKKDLLFSDIITPKHLSKNQFAYFVKYLQSDLIKYFYEKQQYINSHTPSGFYGIDTKSMLECSHLLVKHFIDYKNLQGITLPEEVKCGEFYNHLLLNCMLYDENGYVCPLVMSDFRRALTIKIFERNTNFVPNKQSELVQTIKDVLSSRNSVRCGAEIDDDYIIESTKDIDFNLFLMDTSPDTYKTLLPQIDKSVFENKTVLNKVFENVLSTNLEKMNFIKLLPNDIKQSEIVKKQLENVKNKLNNFTR